MNCKNCGEPIERCEWVDGPGWIHKRRTTEPHLARRCRQMFAQPAEPEPAEIPPVQPWEHVLSGDGDLG